jgi:Tfp pilus assembly protein PilE
MAALTTNDVYTAKAVVLVQLESITYPSFSDYILNYSSHISRVAAPLRDNIHLHQSRYTGDCCQRSVKTQVLGDTNSVPVNQMNISFRVIFVVSP